MTTQPGFTDGSQPTSFRFVVSSSGNCLAALDSEVITMGERLKRKGFDIHLMHSKFHVPQYGSFGYPPSWNYGDMLSDQWKWTQDEACKWLPEFKPKGSTAEERYDEFKTWMSATSAEMDTARLYPLLKMKVTQGPCDESKGEEWVLTFDASGVLTRPNSTW